MPDRQSHSTRGVKAADSPRWCEWCQKYGDHHTDRHGCAGCTKPLDDLSGRPVVAAGGADGNVYYHERCVQP